MDNQMNSAEIGNLSTPVAPKSILTGGFVLGIVVLLAILGLIIDFILMNKINSQVTSLTEKISGLESDVSDLSSQVSQIKGNVKPSGGVGGGATSTLPVRPTGGVVATGTLPIGQDGQAVFNKLCGDGICDEIEKSKGVCPADCD